MESFAENVFYTTENEILESSIEMILDYVLNRYWKLICFEVFKGIFSFLALLIRILKHKVLVYFTLIKGFLF